MLFGGELGGGLVASDANRAQQARILDALRDRRNIGYHNFLDPLLYMGFIFALGLVAARNFDITLRNPKTLWLYSIEL